jgi:MFS family permease
MNSFSNRYVVLLIGIIETVSTVGSIVAANPLYELLNKFGWHVTGVVLIAVFALLLAMIYLFIVNDANRKIESISRSEILSRLKTIMTNKAVILLIAYAFLNWFIIMSFAGYWIRDYMVHIHGYSTGVALMLSNIYWGSFLVGNLVIGAYAHTYKRIKSMTFILAKSSLIIFLILIIPSVYSYYTIIIFCIVAGISSVAVILSFAMIPYVTKENKDKDIISSIVNMAIVTGGVVGQYSFGYVVFHSHVQKIYFHNPLFSNSYYLALWIYVAAAFMAWAVFMKLSKLLVENEHE